MKRLNLTMALGLCLAFGSDLSGAQAVDTLLTKPLPPPTDGQEAQMLTVRYAPGESSLPHRHHAHTFVYVLEGSIEMAVNGDSPRRLSVGETFYESPEDVHTVSRNASDSEEALFLVFFVKGEGAPSTVPVEQAAGH